MFGPKGRVYAPYILLRSLELWKDKKIIKLPDDIRDLIKETYKERSGEPKSWQKLFEEIEEFKKDESVEEFADILEVLEAIADYKRFDRREVERIKEKKTDDRGKFKERIILDES